MKNKSKVIRGLRASRVYLALIVFSALILMVQVGSAAPGGKTAGGIPEIVVSPELTPTSELVGIGDNAFSRQIIDKDRGLSLQIPSTWHELDMSMLRYFERRCFAPVPGNNLAKPQFCIDLAPWVEDMGGNHFLSNDSRVQQDFFKTLNDQRSGQLDREGSTTYAIVRKFSLSGSPAIERIETDEDVEGAEPSYTISIYVNHRRLGLIRLAMLAANQQQFNEYETSLRQIADSFSAPE